MRASRACAPQATQAIETAGLSAATLDKVIAKTRKAGCAEMVDTVTQSVAGVGAVIPVGSTPFAAISIAAIQPRMAPSRRAELGQLLIEALRQPP